MIPNIYSVPENLHETMFKGNGIVISPENLVVPAHEEKYDYMHVFHALENYSVHPLNKIVDLYSHLKDTGRMIITVYDFEMYEKSMWPSLFNDNHRWTFHTDTYPHVPQIINIWKLVDDLKGLGFEGVRPVKIDLNYDPVNQYDQTKLGAPCSWEILVCKDVISKYEPKPETTVETLVEAETSEFGVVLVEPEVPEVKTPQKPGRKPGRKPAVKPAPVENLPPVEKKKAGRPAKKPVV